MCCDLETIFSYIPNNFILSQPKTIEMNNPTNQDLGQIDLYGPIKKYSKLFISNSVKFIRSNLKVLFLLFMAGAIIGYIHQTVSKSYESSFIVVPNFDSNEYLYDKINLIDRKLKEGDTVFFAENKISDIDKIVSIEIEPVIDIFGFIEHRDDKFRMIELMAEDSNVHKVIEDANTSTYYRYHKIKLVSSDLINSSTIENIMNFLNASEYFESRKKVYVDNVKFKIEQNNLTISLIDKVLENNNKTSSQHNVLIQYNNLGEVIENKTKLLNINKGLLLDLSDYNYIIKLSSKNLNYTTKPSLTDHKVILYPILLIALFVFGRVVLKIVRKVS